MKVIDVNGESFQEVDVKGHMALFTELRVDKNTIPEGVNCYELRHGDDDSYPAALEQNVRINYFGAVLMTDKMELGEKGWIELSYDDFGFSGEELSVLELQANYGEEPDELSDVADLVSFAENDLNFPMTKKEADKLLGYMEGHEYLLGKKEGKLFQGDLCYEHGKVRWREVTIDYVINRVTEWNYELLESAKSEMECADPSNFAEAKEYYDTLCEDEKILDKLFDRTKYGKELNDLAEKIAMDFIQDMQLPGGIDGAIQRMTEEIAAGKDLLPDISPELKQREGKAR